MKRDVIIGKYTLESLTNGMYAVPLDLYREYIQNAVDSIDEAMEIKICNPDDYHIKVNVNDEKRIIVIEDNGKGLSIAEAPKQLIDIGNSKKNRKTSRGFRGIGRLAGLGYCDSLVFSTSLYGEAEKTVVAFNAEELEHLLLDKMANDDSVESVLEKVISVDRKPEKKKEHYFRVELIGVKNVGKLLDLDGVKDYLIQHAPLKYDNRFRWHTVIEEKIKSYGYSIPAYNIYLNEEPLYKPYQDTFVSDRVKRNTDSIMDVEVVPLYNKEKLMAVLWCAQTNYYGTIIDNDIKGVRIRQGNILIGDKFSCSPFFKEERFNGWLIGELHVFDEDLIANARRDSFEKNTAYAVLSEAMWGWSTGRSKEIRKISYARSLSTKKQALLEADDINDVNELIDESDEMVNDVWESNYIDQGESESVAETDYIGKLSALLNQRKAYTKYTALNINRDLTIEQRKVLERVFDLIVDTYNKKQAERFINTISERF